MVNNVNSNSEEEYLLYMQQIQEEEISEDVQKKGEEIGNAAISSATSPTDSSTTPTSIQSTNSVDDNTEDLKRKWNHFKQQVGGM